MPSLIEIILQARDNTSAGFSSAQANLRGFTQSIEQDQARFASLGAGAQNAVRQVATSSSAMAGGLRTTQSALMAVGATSAATQARIGELTNRIERQQQALSILDIRLGSAVTRYGVFSTQAQQAMLQINRTTDSLQAYQSRLQQTQAAETGGIGRIATAAGGATPAVLGLGGALGGARAALGAFGLYLGAQQIVQFGRDALQSANSLEQTEVTVRGLAGTTQGYVAILDAARTNQRLFGGSLQQNLEGLQSMGLLARTTAVNIGALNQVSQQLAFKSPEQGATGAMIALTELLTGRGAQSTRSLQLRYEIPVNTLRAIAALPDPSAKLAALNRAMADQGITTDVINSKLDTTAQKYRDLGIAADYATARVGHYLAVAGAGPAGFAAAVLSGVNTTPPSLGQYQTGPEQAAAALGMAPRRGTTGFGGPGVFIGPERQLNTYAGIVGAGATAERPPLIITPQPVSRVTPQPTMTAAAAQPVTLPAQPRFGGFSPGTTVINNTPITVEGSVIHQDDLADFVTRRQQEAARQNAYVHGAP